MGRKKRYTVEARDWQEFAQLTLFTIDGLLYYFNSQYLPEALLVTVGYILYLIYWTKPKPPAKK